MGNNSLFKKKRKDGKRKNGKYLGNIYFPRNYINIFFDIFINGK